jgi:DNA recombination protein Rad52
VIGKLRRPLDRRLIKWRAGGDDDGDGGGRRGGGRQVPYITGATAIDQANEIFGYDGWCSDVLDVQAIPVERRKQNTGEIIPLTLYRATVRVSIPAWGIHRTDVGSVLTSNNSPEAHDTALKGCVTDGLKRALHQFGPQFGAELYDKEAVAALQQPAAAAGRRWQSQQPQRQQQRQGAPQPPPAAAATTSAEAQAQEAERAARQRQTVQMERIARTAGLPVADLQEWARGRSGSPWGEMTTADRDGVLGVLEQRVSRRAASEAAGVGAVAAGAMNGRATA